MANSAVHAGTYPHEVSLVNYEWHTGGPDGKLVQFNSEKF